MKDFLERHPELSARSSRIFEAKKFTTDDDRRAQVFFKSLKEFAREHNPGPDHVWNMDTSMTG